MYRELSRAEKQTLFRQMQDYESHRNLVNFVQDFYPGEQAYKVAIDLVQGSEGTEVSAVHVFDRDGHALLPDLSTSYWQEVLATDPDFFTLCAGDIPAMLESIYDYLRSDRIYREYGIRSTEEEEGLLLDAWPQVTYPHIYTKEGEE